MKVLWISPGFAAHENDTSCIPPLQLLALELKTMGIDLNIVTIAYPQTLDPYTWNSISIKSVYGWNRNRIRWINWIRAYRSALKLYSEKKFDVIHSFWLGPSWLIGKYLSKKFSLPHVTTLMGQDVLKNNLYLHLIKPNDVNQLIAVSSYQADIFKQTTGSLPPHIIEWGLSKNELLHEERPKNIDIIGCGSLISVKNWFSWINIVSRIIDQDQNLKAIIIGDGPEKNNIQKYIHSKRKNGNILLAGSLSRPEVLATMSRSKIFLHTSKYESYAFVLAEAYAMGCSIVSTPVGIAEKYGDTAFNEDDLYNLVLENLKNNSVNKKADIPKIENTTKHYMHLYQEQISTFS